ncbi:LysE family translocator [Halegenticoccus tardaugens]|uniref:LysE family translocator n=1 Tax=Halegenticoccus tardaugens TaxID=2071624 RepID=UPI00100A5B5E|nr:LysE family translocator [Halegenticoccus tardaugens]
MVELATLAAFVPAVLAIIIAPGPDTVYTVTQSLRGGRSAGFIAGLGTATGVLVHTAAAVLGLAALLRTSVLAYTVVKYVGAAYLLYLGVQMFRSDERFELQTNLAEQDYSLAESYRKAVVINVSNPKVAVFVLAFFPQFVPATANASLQMSILGMLYAGLSVLYLGGVALFASQVRHRLLHSDAIRKAVQYVSGSILVGFGVKLALEKHSIN